MEHSFKQFVISMAFCLGAVLAHFFDANELPFVIGLLVLIPSAFVLYYQPIEKLASWISRPIQYAVFIFLGAVLVYILALLIPSIMSNGFAWKSHQFLYAILLTALSSLIHFWDVAKHRA